MILLRSLQCLSELFCFFYLLFHNIRGSRRSSCAFLPTSLQAAAISEPLPPSRHVVTGSGRYLRLGTLFRERSSCQILQIDDPDLLHQSSVFFNP